jgi:hypothetical protein
LWRRLRVELRAQAFDILPKVFAILAAGVTLADAARERFEQRLDRVVGPAALEQPEYDRTNGSGSILVGI